MAKKKAVRETASTPRTPQPAKKTATTATVKDSAPRSGSDGDGSTLGTTRLLEVLTAFRKGDFSQRMPVDQTGVEGKICDTLNDIIDLSQSQLIEENRVADVVGREGRFTQRAAT